MAVPYNDDAFLINTEETCFLIRLGKNQKDKILKEPYTLASGDVLEFGDTFTAIGTSGSAGNQPIKLTPPWVQKYEGIAIIPESDSWYPNRKFIIFSAFIPDSETEGFCFPKEGDGKPVGTKEGYFMAYLDQGNGTLFHLRGKSGSSSVAQCKSITRYPLVA